MFEGWPSECSYVKIFQWCFRPIYTRFALSWWRIKKGISELKRPPNSCIEVLCFFLGEFNLLFALKACQSRNNLIKYYSVILGMFRPPFCLTQTKRSLPRGLDSSILLAQAFESVFVSFNKILLSWTHSHCNPATLFFCSVLCPNW